MDGTRETGTILDRILAQTAIDAALREQRAPVTELERKAAALPAPPSLREAVLRPGLSLIAEVKRASPSKGRFAVEIEPSALAAEYISGGADAISVLTDEPFFQGSLDDLREVCAVAARADAPVPVLRKDFIIGRYQMLEARVHGASAILLIVAALEQGLLADLMSQAAELGLDALVEVHDEREMALAGDVSATLIGINNRDLHTFDVDLAVSERLAKVAPSGSALVGESGIFSAADAEHMAEAGMDAVLVGEALVLAKSRADAIGALRIGAPYAVSDD
ncbi:indole-3-glycerol phosphate synthase TrpC [soil metagenome]